MRTEINRRKLFSRRAVILGGGKLVVFSTLLARLYQLQILNSEEYQTLSDNNRIKLRLTVPERGLILDRRGVPLARNNENYRLFLYKAAYKQNKETIDYLSILSSLLERTPEQLTYAMENSDRAADAYLMAEHLTWTQLSHIEVRKPDLPGIFVDIGRVRHYPFKEVTAHTVGYVGAVSESDPDYESFKRLPDLKIGKHGLEKALDERLRGTPGVKQQEVNSLGTTIREAISKPSQKGSDTTSALDAELLRYIYDRLSQERSASAVVIDLKTGEVLSLASFPGFDPNQFSRGISNKDWNQLLNNPQTPLMNKAIAGQYPPGSTFKMLTALAGLEAGIITPQTRFYCPGHFTLGRRRFHCWKREGHGSMDLSNAIAGSCDVYFYHVGLEVGIDKIAAMARKFGLGEKPEIDIPGAKSALIPDRDWKLARGGDPWQRGDTVNASIGQGYVLATPLQLAMMAARLATGRAISPTMLKRTEGQAPTWPRLSVDPAHLAAVREGMHRVTNSPSGTAYWRRITEKNYAMAGKTGTSQVVALSKLKGLSVEEQAWKNRHHALFVAYAPTHAPRFAASVVVEHGGSGSSAAAPVARDILLKTQQLAERWFAPSPTPPEMEGPPPLEKAT